MRWSCIASWSSALVLGAALPAAADSVGARLGLPPPDPVLHYTLVGEKVAVMPRDIAAIEISESGGITDIFLRFEADAAARLAAETTTGLGRTLAVHVCGTLMLEVVVQAPIDSGTLYIPGTNALRAEGMRALWHGRARCDTLEAEVFEHGKR